MRGELRAWGLNPERDDLGLITSEMVTNAIVHGGGSVDVTLRLAGDTLRLEVTDHGTPGPDIGRRDLGPAALGGWGLQLVAALSDDWGARRDDGGTRVWAERRVRGGGGAHGPPRRT